MISRVRLSLAWLLLATSSLLAAASVGAATTLRMLADSPRGTTMQLAQDIAAMAAGPADVELDVLPANATDSLQRLRYERGVHVALVAVDVYQALLDAATRGEAEAIDIVRPLRIVMPLHHEELVFIARADAEVAFVDEIGDLRLNLGERGSGTALAVSAVHRLLFGAPPGVATTWYATEEALARLITDRSVDVVPVVAGQPAPILADMKPEARRFVKVLQMRPSHPSTERVLAKYRAMVVRERSYPNLLTADLRVPGIAMVMVANDHDSRPVRDALARLARSVCRNLDVLRQNGHSKWREIGIALPDLGTGWAYHPATSKEINMCIADRVAGGNDASN